MNKHQINLPESEFKMLITAYEDRLRKHIKPLQRFETVITMFGNVSLLNLKTEWQIITIM